MVLKFNTTCTSTVRPRKIDSLFIIPVRPWFKVPCLHFLFVLFGRCSMVAKPTMTLCRIVKPSCSFERPTVGLPKPSCGSRLPKRSTCRSVWPSAAAQWLFWSYNHDQKINPPPPTPPPEQSHQTRTSITRSHYVPDVRTNPMQEGWWGSVQPNLCIHRYHISHVLLGDHGLLLYTMCACHSNWH